MVYFGEELATFVCDVGVFLPRKFKLTLRIFELISQRKYNPFVVRPDTIGKGIGGVTLEREDRRRIVLCLANIEVDSVKAEVCDCKKSMNNQL